MSALSPLLVIVLAAAPATRPAGDAPTPAELEAAAREEFRDQIAPPPGMVTLRPMSRRELLRLDEDGPYLDARLLIADPLPGTVVVPLTDWPGVTKVANTGGSFGPGEVIRLTHQSADDPRFTSVSTEVFRVGDDLQIARTAEAGDVFLNVALKQNAALDLPEDQTVTLYVQVVPDDEEADAGEGGPEAVRLERTAATYADLRAQHPDDVAKYLDPILDDLRGNGFSADPAVARQVLLPHLDVDSATEAAAAEQLDLLASEDYRVRRDAERALADLGTPAAVALARLDPEALTAEQRAAIGRLTRGLLVLDEADAAELRDDAEFLNTVRGGDDPALAAAAARRLAELPATRPADTAEGGR